MATTVKRVPGGKVSNWMLDNLVEGDEVTLTRAAGTFCLTPTSVPLLGFSGGSGVTPILSLVKSALATTDREVRLLCADKDRASVIFDAVLDDLVARYPDRLSVVRHIDAERGLIEPATVVDFVGCRYRRRLLRLRARRFHVGRHVGTSRTREGVHRRLRRGACPDGRRRCTATRFGRRCRKGRGHHHDPP